MMRNTEKAQEITVEQEMNVEQNIDGSNTEGDSRKRERALTPLKERKSKKNKVKT